MSELRARSSSNNKKQSPRVAVFRCLDASSSCLLRFRLAALAEVCSNELHSAMANAGKVENAINVGICETRSLQNRVGAEVCTETSAEERQRAQKGTTQIEREKALASGEEQEVIKRLQSRKFSDQLLFRPRVKGGERTVGRTGQKIVQVCELFLRERLLVRFPSVLMSSLEIGESRTNGGRQRRRGGRMLRHGLDHDARNERRDFVRERLDERADAENGRVCLRDEHSSSV